MVCVFLMVFNDAAKVHAYPLTWLKMLVVMVTGGCDHLWGSSILLLVNQVIHTVAGTCSSTTCKPLTMNHQLLTSCLGFWLQPCNHVDFQHSQLRRALHGVCQLLIRDFNRSLLSVIVCVSE